jgi:phage shock protein C
MEKRLYRSTTDRKLNGVCGGIAEYLGVDSTLVRAAFLLLTLAGGPGFFLYIILWMIMPENPNRFAKLKNDQI